MLTREIRAQHNIYICTTVTVLLELHLETTGEKLPNSFDEIKISSVPSLNIQQIF